MGSSRKGSALSKVKVCVCSAPQEEPSSSIVAIAQPSIGCEHEEGSCGSLSQGSEQGQTPITVQHQTATIKIQSLMRGRKARATARLLRRNVAAIRLQAVLRGKW